MTSTSTSPTPPPWARPSHHVLTPRLILRTALVSDANAFTIVRRSPANCPHGGVVNAGLSEEEQAVALGKQNASTTAGKNAWMVIVLRHSEEQEVDLSEEEKKWRVELKVEDGWLIGMSGFNSFPLENFSREKGGEGQEVLLGDLGVLIDSQFLHWGYASETLQALFELGFNEMGIDIMILETEIENAQFRSLMKSMVGEWRVKVLGGKVWCLELDGRSGGLRRRS